MARRSGAVKVGRKRGVVPRAHGGDRGRNGKSHKEKRSAYAPEKGVRYDGVYRIEKCWRKVGIQGFKVCRYLFVRCDNEPAPWTSDEQGDRPRSLPLIQELKKATDVTERKESPAWDFDEEDGRWKWKIPPPMSRKSVNTANAEDRKRARKVIRQAQNTTIRERLLKEFSCQICRGVMNLPITTPCAHNFCKSCLEAAFAGKTFVRERSRGGRTLRSQKNVMNCPRCPTDISDFLQNLQVNRELMGVIESLKSKSEENGENAEESSEEMEGQEENPDLTSKDDEPKPKRTCRQVNVDAGDCSGKNDEGMENKISADKAGGLDGETEANKIQPVVPGDSDMVDAEVKTGIKKAEGAATDDRNDSPSSTLHVQTSDEDLE
ncbi:E3 ubiquitin-protein ligase ORTHRUS 2-like [Carica papaya]|uniref:E3 ubiquitin-protein ligase ORTHRUS 2-like n=1 Tax=Carica papaya TaxID=3649 RepID=UPI000B8CBF60|nr:E3 ubiquitin-protein ligase ORTHRUS 2-like [Carica papaya]